MPILRIPPPDISSNQTTKLTAALAAAGTAVTAENTAGIVAGDYVVFGNVGEEKTEVKLISAVADVNSMTTAAVDFAHSIGAPITKTDFNQIRIQSATSETGTFTTIVTVNIQYDHPETIYQDTSGASTTWYKFAYFDSDDSIVTDFSDAIQATGYKARSLGRMIIDIRRELRIQDDQSVITDDELISMINNSHTELADERSWPFLETTSSASTTDSTQTVALPTNIKPGTLTAINILVSGVNYQPKYIPYNEFLRLDRSDGLEATQSAITRYTIWDDDVFLWPIPESTGSSDVTFYHHKIPDVLSDINAQSDFPNVDYFIYDVCHHLSAALERSARQIDNFERLRGRAFVRMSRYGAKQSERPTRVRRIHTDTVLDPNFFTEITSD